MYMHVYIYIYIYIYIQREREREISAARETENRTAEKVLSEMVSAETAKRRALRPIPLLTLSLLTLLESNFPGKSLGNPYGPGNSTPLD